MGLLKTIISLLLPKKGERAKGPVPITTKFFSTGSQS